MHPRRAIREAVVALLKAKDANGKFKTAAHDRIHEMEFDKLLQAKLPAIVVYTFGGSSELFEEAPRRYRRTCTVAVEIAADGKNIAGDLDDLAEQVEAALLQDETFGAVVSDSRLSSDEIEIFTDGSKSIGSLRMDFDVTYYTDAPAPGAEVPALGAFEGMDVDWDTSKVIEDQIEAQDKVELPQE